MRKYFLFLTLLLGILLPSAAESSFKLDFTIDSILLGTSAAVMSTSLLVEPAPAVQEPAAEINPLDIALMFPYSENLDDFGTIAASAMLVLPGVAAIGKIEETDSLLTYAVMYTEAFLLTYGTKDLIKDLAPRARPWSYSSLPGPDDAAEKQYQSFPSGHTSFAFLGASILTAVLVNDYGDELWTPYVSAASYTLAAVIAGMRVASGEHFLTDVIAGAAVGSFFGWVIPILHLNNRQAEESEGLPVVALSSNSIGLKISY